MQIKCTPQELGDAVNGKLFDGEPISVIGVSDHLTHR